MASTSSSYLPYEMTANKSHDYPFPLRLACRATAVELINVICQSSHAYLYSMSHVESFQAWCGGTRCKQAGSVRRQARDLVALSEPTTHRDFCLVHNNWTKLYQNKRWGSRFITPPSAFRWKMQTRISYSHSIGPFIDDHGLLSVDPSSKLLAKFCMAATHAHHTIFFPSYTFFLFLLLCAISPH